MMGRSLEKEWRIGRFVRDERKKLGMTQAEMADRAGVGLRFVRELEQGKETVRLDKVNQVLSLFGYELAPSRTRFGQSGA